MAVKVPGDVPDGMQRVSALRALAQFPSGAIADSSRVVGFRRGGSSGAWCVPNRQGFAPGVRQAQANGGIRASQGAPSGDTGNILGTDAIPGGRCIGVLNRVRRATWQDPYPVEGRHGA